MPAWGRRTSSPWRWRTPDTGNDSGEFYLILGGGAAGLNAAKAIRERDKTGTITLVSDDERPPPYNRPMLTKSILAGLTAEQIAVEPERWYEEQNICLVLGRRVTAVDPGREAGGAGRRQQAPLHPPHLRPWASGVFRAPPSRAADKEQVVAIRRLEDTQERSSP